MNVGKRVWVENQAAVGFLLPEPTDSINGARPVLADLHGRTLTYLRLAVTDRCNLRCSYCMPADGIRFLPRAGILTFEEMERLVTLLIGMGITKVRVTGGEPFARRGLMWFLTRLVAIPGMRSLHITTNGVLTAPLIPQLKGMGIAGVNVSLETLSREEFIRITRRDALDDVLRTVDEAILHELPIKINAVVHGSATDDSILALSRLAADRPIDVRFIEQMKFGGTLEVEGDWNESRVFGVLKRAYPGIARIEGHGSTAVVHDVPGFSGTLGIIGGRSRSFCGSCNRIRVTPAGELRTCLYSQRSLDLKLLMREGASDSELRTVICAAVQARPRDGHAAESLAASRTAQSMASIGG